MVERIEVSLKSLGPLFIDADGLIRCVGRFRHSNLTEEAQFPKLMPRSDSYAKLVIEECHRQFNHAGVKQTLAELRCEYWITQGRSEVKKVLSRCPTCKRQKGGPFQTPPPPDLPNFRVTKKPPFTCVGLDYLGPLYIRSSEGKKKVWICLFTCAVTRAIHLEVIESMDSANFLLCFRRFISFCGCPEQIVSDNASQFLLSRQILNRLWQEAIGSENVQELFASKGITWKFIVESAAWMGGFYERLVGVAKNSLKAAIDGKKLSLTELVTVAYEVAAVVNSRPLVYVEDEVGDLPLTPAHLMMRHRTVAPFTSDESEDDGGIPTSNKAKLVAGWKRIAAVTDEFWHSWQKHYLLSLRERKTTGKQRNVSRYSPKVDEAVLLEEKNIARAHWRVERIRDLIISADGRCRSAKIAVPGGKVLNRPIKLLYPLEVRDDDPTIVLMRVPREDHHGPLQTQRAPALQHGPDTTHAKGPLQTQCDPITRPPQTRRAIPSADDNLVGQDAHNNDVPSTSTQSKPTTNPTGPTPTPMAGAAPIRHAARTHWASRVVSKR